MWTVCCSVPNITFIGALCCLCGAKDHWVNAVPTCCPEGRLAGNQSVSRSQWFKESTWWPRYDHWTDNAQTAWRRQPMHIWPSRRTINKTYITELTSFQAADGKLAIFVFAFVENWPNESTSTVQWTSDKLQHCCQSFIRACLCPAIRYLLELISFTQTFFFFFFFFLTHGPCEPLRPMTTLCTCLYQLHLRKPVSMKQT